MRDDSIKTMFKISRHNTIGNSKPKNYHRDFEDLPFHENQYRNRRSRKNIPHWDVSFDKNAFIRILNSHVAKGFEWSDWLSFYKKIQEHISDYGNDYRNRFEEEIKAIVITDTWFADNGEIYYNDNGVNKKVLTSNASFWLCPDCGFFHPMDFYIGKFPKYPVFHSKEEGWNKSKTFIQKDGDWYLVQMGFPDKYTIDHDTFLNEDLTVAKMQKYYGETHYVHNCWKLENWEIIFINLPKTIQH